MSGYSIHNSLVFGKPLPPISQLFYRFFSSFSGFFLFSSEGIFAILSKNSQFFTYSTSARHRTPRGRSPRRLPVHRPLPPSPDRGGYDGESFLLCGVSSQKDVRGRERIGPNPLQDGWGCAIMGTLERCQLGEWGLPRSFFYESSLVLSPAGGAGRFSDRFSSRAAGRREVFIVCLKSRI